MKTLNAYTAFRRVKDRVERNYEDMREEPDSDGETHDQWEAENDAMEELVEALEAAEEAFDAAREVRRSVGRIAIEV